MGRVLLIHRGALGDMVLCFPLFQALKEKGFNHRTLVTHPSHGDLARHFSLCEAVYSCDRAPVYRVSDYDAVFTLVSRPREPGIHAQDCLFREARLSHPGFPDYWQGGGRVLVHPGSGGKGKNFPPECFLGLHRAIGSDFLLGPVEIEQGLPWPGIPVRPGSLIELAEVLKKTGLLISHDSGVAHLAAWMGVPTLVLFKTSNPAVWAPRGRRVRVLEMKEWDDKRVLAGLEKLLKSRYA